MSGSRFRLLPRPNATPRYGDSTALPARVRVGIAGVVLLGTFLGSCSDGQPETGRDGSDAAGGTDAQKASPNPDRFGFGTLVSPERIALWDIDIKPDGEGLPPGSGSVAEGRAIYNSQCVACHGLTGTEGPNDPLVGPPPGDDWPRSRAAGHYWPYATTLYDYIRRAMPQLTPGILSADETYSVVAYILNLNGLLTEGELLDSATLTNIEMPARDRFVIDDRRGGPEIR